MTGRRDGVSTWLWPAALAVLVIVVYYLPFAGTPFFQDDYVFLYKAKEQAAEGQWLAWLTETSGQGTFWRPISVGLYWLMVEWMSLSAWGAHFINIVILGVACAAAGVLGGRLAELKSRIGNRRGRAVFWSAVLYGLNGCWLLPVVWACAIQETLAVLFSVLALLAWMRLVQGEVSVRRQWTLGPAAVGCLGLGLLCKEGVVVVPLLAGFLAWHFRRKTGRAVWWVGGAGVCVTIAWLATRSWLTDVQAGSPYAWALGKNVVQNGVALPLFMLNFPREAMAGWLQSRSMELLMWGAGCFALQAVAVAGFLWKAGWRFPWMVGMLWVVCALLPYYPLRGQCYPYYACLALLVYPWLVATVVGGGRGVVVYGAVIAAICSSIMVYVMEIRLEIPAPIARAYMAERVLGELRKQNGTLSKTDLPVAVEVEDEAMYAAGGYLAGPSLALGLKQDDLREADEGTSAAMVLRVTSDGYRWVPSE